MRIIAGLLRKGKNLLQAVPDGALTALVVVLAASFSFGLGTWYGSETRSGQVSIEQLPLVEEPQALQTAPARAISAAPAVPDAMPAGGQYVASKKGSKYHLPWCSGAKSMSEENKIWFSTKAEAEAAGYEPASNCKGI
jgi:hypothetical protein